MKITIPLNEVLSGGSLKDFYDDLVKVQSGLTIFNDATTVFIQNGNLTISIGDMLQILNVGGEVEEYLMAIRADILLLGMDIPNGIPNQNTIDEAAQAEVRKFKNWFDTTAELYLNDANTKIYFLTNPIGNSIVEYLKASELLILSQIVGAAIEVRTAEQFNVDIQSGWNPVNF